MHQTRGMVRSIVMGTGTGEKYDGDVHRHVPCAYEKEVQRDDASATQDSAVRLLDPYKKQFEENAMIRAYYGVQVNLGNWCAEEFVAKCGCSFRAVGAGNAPRGSRNGAVVRMCCWWMTSIRMKAAGIRTR